MRVEIRDADLVYDGIFKLNRIALCHERYDGTMSSVKTVLNLERGDAAAVLLRDVERDTVLLTEQFRYGAYQRTGEGWIVDLVAGIVEEGETAEKAARREALEEVGYQLDGLEFVASFFVSPGGTTERIHLFYAPVSPLQRVCQGGGTGGENIRLLELTADDAWARVEDGRIRDAKTIIALQWLRLRSLAPSSAARP